MALVIPANFAEVTFEFQHEAAQRPWAITYGIDMGNAPDDPQVCALHQIEAWEDSTLKDRHDASITLASVTVRAGAGAGPGPIHEEPYGVAGGLPMSTPPSNLALLVKKISASGGRYNRGRNYWPGFLSEGDLDEVGLVGSAARAAIQTDMTAFLTALAAPAGDASVNGTAMYILHDETSPVTTPTAVTSYIVDAVAATQRRRMRR